MENIQKLGDFIKKNTLENSITKNVEILKQFNILLQSIVFKKKERNVGEEEILTKKKK